MYWYGCCCATNEFSRLWFCFCLWPGCNNLDACLWHLIFLWICGNFCIVLNRIDHIFDRSIGNSDPRMRTVLVHGLNSNFNSIFKVLEKLVVTSNTGPILMFPWIHPFACEAGSSRWRVYSRQATARNCLLNHQCPLSWNTVPLQQHVQILLPIQNLLTLLSCENDLIRSSYCCHRIWWFIEFFASAKGTSALIFTENNWLTPSESQVPPDRSWWLSNSSHTAAH